MSKRLSIIIPVYNTDQFFEACLLSCVQQDLLPEEFEIIIVNDGSTDNSLQIANRLKTNFSNIIIIDKPNGGVSSARNTGLNAAQGKYVWFVDSDDWIETNCVKNLVTLMESELLDALQIEFCVATDSKITPSADWFRGTTPILNPVEYVLPDRFVGGVCGTIFKREVAVNNAIYFDEDLCLAEDQLFFLSIFNFSKRVKRQNALVYFYRFHTGSLRTSATEEQLHQSISKIDSFRFRKTFEEYCDYLIATQCLICLGLPRKNIFRLHNVLKNIPLERQQTYKNTAIGGKRLLKYYSHFGLLFLLALDWIRYFRRIIRSLK